MGSFALHLLFDLAALVVAVVAGFVVYRGAFPSEYKHPAVAGHRHYAITLSIGSLFGATLLGTLNLHVSGVPGIGRSILGAILGAVVAVEWYKARHGLRESTGAVLVIPLAVGIAVGRVGCFLAGLTDYTYGTATDLPWGWDFGDGVTRHPVQLYESLSMLLAACVFLLFLLRRPQLTMSRGFYLFAGWYGLQRFGLEFLKPYEGLTGSLNVFHFGTLLLMAYALYMLRGIKYAQS